MKEKKEIKGLGLLVVERIQVEQGPELTEIVFKAFQRVMRSDCKYSVTRARRIGKALIGAVEGALASIADRPSEKYLELIEPCLLSMSEADRELFDRTYVRLCAVLERGIESAEQVIMTEIDNRITH